MHISYTYYIFDGIFHLKLSGDFIGISEEKKLLSLIDAYVSFSIRNFVLDLSGVNHINSSGLSYLIRMMNKVEKGNGLLVLLNPSKQVSKLLEITKLGSLCKIVQSPKEAYGVFL